MQQLSPPPVAARTAADLMAADMLQVNGVIQRRLASDVAMINQIANYIISAGGKRIRPMLVLLFSRALGFAGPERHELAATVEFIHTATLLHDDVVDESALRRGRQTANALFGNAASVLVGDFVYSRAFQMMVSVRRRSPVALRCATRSRRIPGRSVRAKRASLQTRWAPRIIPRI